jgi:hypothetical protein
VRRGVTVNRVEPFDPTSALPDDCLNAVAALARAIGAHAVVRDVGLLSRRLDHGRLFVAVLAPTRTHRAEIVNALVGEAVVPLDADRLAIPIAIRFGSKRCARIAFEDDLTREIDIEQLRRLVLPATNRDNDRRVRRIEACCDGPLMRDGVCLVDGVRETLVGKCAWLPRIDLVVCDTRESRQDECPWGVERANMVPMDPMRPEDVSRVAAMIADRALDMGAIEVEQIRRQEAARFCSRLERRLIEERRAIDRSPDDARHHIDAITACVVLFEMLVERRGAEPDPIRESLVRHLEAERRKFLMGSKADLLALLGKRFARDLSNKRDLRSAAHALGRELTIEAVRAWHGSLRRHVDQQIGAMARALVEQTQGALERLGADVPIAAFEGLSMMTSFEPYASQRPLEPNASLWSRWRDAISPERHVRVEAEHEAAERLIESVELDSNRVADSYLRYYDRSRSALESSFANALDDLCQHATVARARAEEACASGRPAIVQACERLDGWLRRVAEIRRSFE